MATCAKVKLFLGHLKRLQPRESRIFTDRGGYLVDLNLAYAAYLTRSRSEAAFVYGLANLYFPRTIVAFLGRGKPSMEALAELSGFLDETDLLSLRGPSGEELIYRPSEVKLLLPVLNPDKTLIVGFSEQVTEPESKLKAKIPTAFYKLPSTFIVSGDPISYPRFTKELDCEACLGMVVGKPGRRIPRERALEHIAGFTLVLDVTARDICRRESLTRNNLLGKNFPGSTSIGPSLYVGSSRQALEGMQVGLRVDDKVCQRFTARDLIFSVEDVVAHWSIVGLKTGDILALGASLALKSGVVRRPAPLRPGSVLKCSSFEIGEINHEVVTETQQTPNP